MSSDAATDERIEPGERLRLRLRERSCEVMPGVWDPLTAILASESGFDVVFVSGFAVAATTLGVPDVGLLTQTEMADVARRVCAAVPDVMVVVDADTGYGNHQNVARTVQLWEAAGAAGLFLEDQVWPKRCGHLAGKRVIERDDWLAKLRASCEVRTHLHVTARTDARADGGLDEAIERGRMARDLGVDAVFVEAPASVEELERVAAALPDVTLVANMVEGGVTPLLDRAELAEMGYRLVVSPVTALLAHVAALRTALGVLGDTGSMRDRTDLLAGFGDVTALVGLDRIREFDERFAAAPDSDPGRQRPRW